LGGLNGVFKTKTPRTHLAPSIALNYEDAMKIGHVSKKFFAAASTEALDTFSHYMSYGLVIVKPAHVSPAQEAFLDAHRRTLSLDNKDLSNKVKSKGGKFEQLNKEIFIETARLFIIPRHYALCLYGPCILFPYKTKTVSIRNPAAFASASAPTPAPTPSRPLPPTVVTSAASSPKTPLHTTKIAPTPAPSYPQSPINFRIDGDYLTENAIAVEKFMSDVITPMEEAVDKANNSSSTSASKQFPPDGALSSSASAMDVDQSNAKKRKSASGGGDDEDYVDEVSDNDDEDDETVADSPSLPSSSPDDVVVTNLHRHLIMNNIGTAGEKASSKGVWIKTPQVVYPMDLFGTATNLSEKVLKNMPIMNDSMLTQPLKMSEEVDGVPLILRNFPVDQLSITAGVVLSWRNSLKFLKDAKSRTGLNWTSGVRPPLQTLPAVMVCLSCGMGKTITAIACWLLALCPIFDSYAGRDFNTCFGGGKNDEEEMELRRICSKEARRTLKAVFVVHGIDLMEQTAEVIQECVPDANIGWIQEKKRPKSLADYDIIMVSADTLAQQEFDEGYFDCVSILIVDESHQYLSSMFVKSLQKIPARLMLCLTATPREWALPYLLGPILAYPKRPYEPQYVNVVFYEAGNGRAIIKRVKNNDMPDLQAQLSWLVVDLARNAWIIHTNSTTTIIGKTDTHRASVELSMQVLKSTLYEVGQSATKTRLFKLDRSSSLWDALTYYTRRRELSSSTSPSPSSTTKPLPPPPQPILPTPGPVKAKPTSAASSAPNNASIASFFKSKSPETNTAPTKSTAPVVLDDGDFPQSSSFSSSNLFGSSLYEQQGAAHKSTQKGSEPRKSEVPNVDPAWSPALSPRKPIVFSDSVQHLIMLQHWQAQHWIDCCTTVPKEHLRIVRTSLRVLSVVDMRQIEGTPFADKLYFLGATSAAEEADPKKRTFQWSEDCAKSPTVAKPWSSKDITFGPAFWKRWFTAYPYSKFLAEECGLRKPTSDGKVAKNAPAWKKRKEAEDKRKKNAPFVTDNASNPYRQMFESSLADNNAPPIVHWSGVSAAADHEASLWMYRSSFFWTLIYGPLPRAEKEKKKVVVVKTEDTDGKGKKASKKTSAASEKKSGAGGWSRMVIVDNREPLPGVMATFGLLIGEYVAPPQVNVTCSRPHIKEALKTSFPFATHAIASTGIDDPRLCSKTDASHEKDDEQSDGRCKRYVRGKQPFLKNEFAESYSLYPTYTRAHAQVYKDERRTVNTYVIESVEP
jgi:hypothetical protein